LCKFLERVLFFQKHLCLVPVPRCPGLSDPFFLQRVRPGLGFSPASPPGAILPDTAFNVPFGIVSFPHFFRRSLKASLRCVGLVFWSSQWGATPQKNCLWPVGRASSFPLRFPIFLHRVLSPQLVPTLLRVKKKPKVCPRPSLFLRFCVHRVPFFLRVFPKTTALIDSVFLYETSMVSRGTRPSPPF